MTRFNQSIRGWFPYYAGYRRGILHQSIKPGHYKLGSSILEVQTIIIH